MDLFCGTGTIGQIPADANVPVVGVDIVPQAIEDAREAATRNGVDNVTFFAADAGKFLLEHPEYKGKLHTVASTRRAQAFRPRPSAKSCGSKPSGLCTSAATPPPSPGFGGIANPRYELKSLKLVDQSSHTAHVEAVALLEKIPNLVS